MPMDAPPPSRQPPRFVPTLTEIFVPAGAGSGTPEESLHDPLLDASAHQAPESLMDQSEDPAADLSQDTSDDRSYDDRSVHQPAGAPVHQPIPPSTHQVTYQAAYTPAYSSTSQPSVAAQDQPEATGIRTPLPNQRSAYLPDAAVIELLARMGPELDARLSETIAQVLHEQMPLLNARIRQAVAEVVRDTVAKAAANPERR